MSEVTYTIKEEVFKEATRIAEKCNEELHRKLYVEKLIPKSGLEAHVRPSWFHRPEAHSRVVDARVIPQGKSNVKDFSWYTEELECKRKELVDGVDWVKKILIELDVEYLRDGYGFGLVTFDRGYERLISVVESFQSKETMVYFTHSSKPNSHYVLKQRFEQFLKKTSTGFSGDVEVCHKIQQEVDWLLESAENLVTSLKYLCIDGESYMDNLAKCTALKEFEDDSNRYFSDGDLFDSEYNYCVEQIKEWKDNNRVDETVEENKDSGEVIQRQPEPFPTSITVGMGVVTGLGVLFLMTVLAKLLG